MCGRPRELVFGGPDVVPVRVRGATAMGVSMSGRRRLGSRAGPLGRGPPSGTHVVPRPGYELRNQSLRACWDLDRAASTRPWSSSLSSSGACAERASAKCRASWVGKRCRSRSRRLTSTGRRCRQTGLSRSEARSALPRRRYSFCVSYRGRVSRCLCCAAAGSYPRLVRPGWLRWGPGSAPAGVGTFTVSSCCDRAPLCQGIAVAEDGNSPA